MEKHKYHDHVPTTGECLILEWEGVKTARYTPEIAKESASLQRRIETNHVNQVKVWHKQMVLDNAKPF